MLISQKKFVTLFEPPNELVLESGRKIGPITVAFETFGSYNRNKPNAILVAHALTGDSHAAGRYHPDDRKPGWWDEAIGPGKPLDTDRYFVICSNILGGCQGTTGPSSIDPATGKPYALTFPVVTIRDMVRVQRELLRYLEVDSLVAVAGGSMGGMQALEWAIMYPDLMLGVIPIAVGGRFHAQGIAYNEVQRQAIMADPNWNGGNYYGGPVPAKGMATARMLGMITYRSDESMTTQFGRSSRGASWEDALAFRPHFEVESYLHHQGDALVRRFDANTYLYLSKAMDLHDVGRGRGSYRQAIALIRARVLVVGIRSDILFPPHQQRELVQMLQMAGLDAEYFEMDSPWGHDAFLVDYHILNPVIKRFLDRLEEEPSPDLAAQENSEAPASSGTRGEKAKKWGRKSSMWVSSDLGTSEAG